MEKFLSVLIIIFSFQSWTKADDIRDFQIVDMSIGDSLTDYFTKKEIDEGKFFEKEQGNRKDVAKFYIREKKGKYDWTTASYKTSDKDYKIIELSGFVFMNFTKCIKERNKIDEDIKSLFTNSERQVTGKVEHFLDKNSFTDNIVYWTSNTKNDLISLTCYDWSDASGYRDQLRIEAYNDEYYKWLSSLE
tara:strand:- start:96 stop:665 length:570 start_codon:yes stop_codon:yes gene_type:complete